MRNRSWTYIIGSALTTGFVMYIISGADEPRRFWLGAAVPLLSSAVALWVRSRNPPE